MAGGFSSGFSSGFGPAVAVATVASPTFIAAPPRPAVVELAVDFVLVTHMSATVTASDEAMAMALLGLPGDSEAAVELWLLLGPRSLLR